MKIKVLLVVPGLGTGGGEKLVLDIASNLDNKKFEVCILSLFPRRGMLFEKVADEIGLETIYLTKRKGVSIKTIFNVYKVLRKYRPDVIHSHLYVIPYILLPTVLNGIGIRIHTIHSLAWREATGIRKLIMKLAYNYFRFIPVAISDFNKNSVISEYKFKANKVSCIYNGVDTIKFQKLKNIKKSAQNNLKLISVGRFEEVKNHRLMIEAFALTHNHYKDIELVLVGDGELRLEIEKLVIEKKLERNIFFTGVSENIVEKLNDADIYLMSSNAEGLPLSVMEAMACSLPIISTKAGGVVDIVEDGWNGLLAPVGNAELLSKAMMKLIKNDELRRKMGLNSRKRALEIDIRKCVKDYEKLYSANFNVTKNKK